MSRLEEKLKDIILESQAIVEKNTYYPRQMKVERIPGKATVITGAFRCGKSVYEKIYMQTLLSQGVSRDNMCIIDFSDDRLIELRSEEPDLVTDAYYELFPEKVSEKVYFFFDEIQYLNHWELFVNRLQNTRTCEVNITGSSAKLLVKEIATEFGGRSLPWELFPFSFREYLETKDDSGRFLDIRRITADQARICRKYLKEYESTGGFPESLMISEADTRVRYLQNLAETVVFRDVIRRYNLSNPEGCYRLMQLLLNQMACLMSFARLKKRLDSEQHRMSAEMVANVTGYLEDAYLIFTVEIFSLNVSVRKTNPKKIYCVDHSVAMAMSGSLTEDYGKILENIVFIHLRRRTDRIYYGKTSDGYEIDFVVLDRGQQISDEKALELIQVSYEMDRGETYEREVRALEAGMQEYHCRHAIIVTDNTEDKVQTKAGTIIIVPAWKYLLKF